MRTLQIFAILSILTFKLKYAEAPLHIDAWVGWNIGQGQWVTHVTNDECRHYDIGGEFGSFKTMRKTLLYFCGAKMNKLNLSHWDYDHFFNIPSLVKTIPNVCWLNQPQYASTKIMAQKILELRLPRCPTATAELKTWTPVSARDTNESSMVFLEQNILMPGDSPIQKEKIWVGEIIDLQKTRVLVLGHHGSRTSTGRDLLEKLPNLLFSISSARHAKYGHPHQETLNRLSDHGIPVLRTEDWGNIWFK